MLKATNTMVVLLAMALVPASRTGAAPAAAQAGDDIDKNIAVLKKGNKVDAETLIAAAEALGQKGPAAAKAVPDLIASFRRPPVVRQAAITALAKIGAPAVPPLLELLDGRDSSNAMRLGIRREAIVACLEVFQNLAPQVKVNTAIPALTALMAERSDFDYVWLNAVDCLAAMGQEAVPALTDTLGREFGVLAVKSGDTLLAEKIGEAVRPAVGRMIREGPAAAWDTVEYHTQVWMSFYSLALVPPDEKHIPALIEQIEKDEHCYVRYVGMVLDRMGPACVPPVASLLKKEDWYSRWAATAVLEMMGPKAGQALPALEKALADSQEDVDVRVGAARAISRIKGVDPFDLYQQIPNVEQRILKTTSDKSMARRQAFVKREGARSDLGGPWEKADGDRIESIPWPRTAWYVYAMLSGQNLELANASLKQAVETGPIRVFMDANLVRVLVMFHSKSCFFPGRLAPDTEAAMKKYFFNHCNGKKGLGRSGADGISTEQLVRGPVFAQALNRNGPLIGNTRDYLALSVLKDDPKYMDVKFEVGDTVTERYHAWNGYFKEFLKDWALNGLWQELGSSSYNYHSYDAYFNLVDLAPDPVVRQRARMFLDLSLIEIDQISISGVRGGVKCRAKKGGLGDKFNTSRAMLYGERGSILSHAAIAASQYQPPEAAVLLHKLGPPVPTFEIANRHPGEYVAGAEPARMLGKGGLRPPLELHSHNINYAYCTPEYVMGCSMYDPNRKYGAGSEARWSGIIFRDLAAISMDAYTGEKWNVQSKDVMIAQRRAGAHYGGRPKVVFESGFEMVERQGWVFVDNGEAFAAVKIVTGGYFWAEPIKRTLYLKYDYSPIIIQTGSSDVYGSFAKFQEAILKARLTLSENKLEYTGPNSNRLEFLLATKPFILPKIDGKTIDLDLKHNYQSPYMQNKVGSDIVTVRYGKRRWDYDFAKNTVIEVKE